MMTEIDLMLLHKEPWFIRFVKQTGRGINRFSMIRDGDRVLLGISGGKDSLALALALQVRKEWVPIDYHIEAVQIEWKEYPLKSDEKNRLLAFFENIDIPFDILTETIMPGSYKEKFDCYRCSRNRKRILFDEAKKRDISKIALGHHLDDIVETVLINVALRGTFAAMMPVQQFFGGELSIIRPLCEVRESMVDSVTTKLNLPVAENDCPYKNTNIRNDIKLIIRQLSRLDKRARENIYRSLWNINTEYLPE